MSKLYNLARVNTGTVGTGTITLGAAVSGFLTFANAGAVDGDVVSYAIRDGANSEIGTGTYNSAGPTLTRTNILRSTNSNTAISLSGTAQVFITPNTADFSSLTQVVVGGVKTNNDARYRKLIKLVAASGQFRLTDQPPAEYIDGDLMVARGKLVFPSPRARIIADMSSGSVIDRFMFQTSVQDSFTSVGILPNGSNTVSALACFSSSDPTNANAGALIQAGADTELHATTFGTATPGTLSFFVNNTQVGQFTVAGNLTLLNALAVLQGGTGSTTASGARTNLGAAASGANTDITSLGGLTTALSPVQGGTGLTSYTIGDLIYASGSSTLSKLAGVATGNALISGGTSTAPSWGKITTAHTTGIAASGANTDITSLTSPIGIGTSAPAGQLDVTCQATTASRGVVASQFTSDAASAFFLGRKARGTLAAPTVVATGDFVTGFAPAAYDGANYQQGGFLGFQANGTIAAGSVPTDFVVYTGTSGLGSQRLIITSTGAATFSGTVTVGSGATPGLSAGLTILHATGAYISVKSGTNPELILGSDASAYGVIGTVSNHSLGFRTNNTLRMTLDTSGNLSLTSGTLNIAGQTTVSSGLATPTNGSAAAAFLMGAGAIGIYWGSGAPGAGFNAAKGSIYLNIAAVTTTTRLYINTNGLAAWTTFTSAA